MTIKILATRKYLVSETFSMKVKLIARVYSFDSQHFKKEAFYKISQHVFWNASA